MALPIKTLKGVHSVVIDEVKIAANQLSIRIYDKAYKPLMHLVLVTDRATTDVVSMMAKPPPPTVTAITFAPPAPTLPDNSPSGTKVSQATVTMSDGSVFSGAYSLADPTGTALAAPTANTLVDRRGTWSFGPSSSGPGGYPLLLNGSQAGGGYGVLLVSYNSQILAENLLGQWFQWNGGWSLIGGDPRRPGLFTITPTGAIVTTRATTPADDGTRTTTVTATTSSGMTMSVRFPS